jgi:CheY-like chemotaxis protein
MARILIVDDDEAVLAAISVLLRAEGHTIATARDGFEGTKRLRAEPSDLVLTDIVMPKCEGLETIVALRRDFPEVGIIAMSGAGIGSDIYLAAGARLGAHCTLSKPFTSAELFNSISVALKKRRVTMPSAAAVR